MSYAILRLSKLTNLGTATSATQHNYRLQDTPNANPDWAALNEEYLNHGHRNYWHLATERIAELHLPRLRHDAVRAVEVVLTASPEGFARDAEGRALDVRGTPWVADNLAFLQATFGAPNVVSFTLHQDEVTPHIHAVVVPVTADGRLSSRDVFSPASLRQLQTDYAQAMAPHGFERGIKYSTALHEDVRRHYGAQRTSQQQLAEVATPVPTGPHLLQAMPPWLEPENHRVREQFRLDHYVHHLTTTSNEKIAQLATVASANALAHDRARVLEKQLARSQEQLALARDGLTPRLAHLTEQLRQAKEQLAAKTTQFSEQQALAKQQILLHKRAVIRHVQGQSVPDWLATLAKGLRERHQRKIEALLAKQLLLPTREVADLKPGLEQAGYVLKVVGPQEWTVQHKEDGTRFRGDELRPNGRNLLEQCREAAERTKEQEPTIQLLPKEREIEM
ncbi:hypothetical protein AXW84_18380 [Hymenobacter sp. PAMC 26628]|nr:hypothetical protein AXW84_18380 [Hymenobacter sp. PAMC 26628]